MQRTNLLKQLIVRIRSDEYSLVTVLAILIGFLGGWGAIGFRLLIQSVQRAGFGTFNYSLDSVFGLPWYMLLLVPALGGLVVGPLVYFFAREAKGHGVPEVMDAVITKSGVIRPRLVIVKALASAITIGTGGAVGREGPIVQIGASLGSALGQKIHISARNLRTLVGCGAAAGIAATFNSPIAGALFALEVILSDFGVFRFTPIVISSVIATVVSRSVLGDFPAFVVPAYELVSPWELIPYAILGLICAVFAVGFVKTLYKTEDIFDRIPIPEYTKPLLGGLILGGLVLVLPRLAGAGYETSGIRLFGLGYETVGEILTKHLDWTLLAILLGGKILATSITLGSGGSGGIFSPSLFLGATAGGIFGTVVHSIFPESTAGAGAYALVGMGAMVAATTHAPLTAMIIIFEITGDYKIVPPLMAACVIGSLLAVRLNKASIYTLKLIRRGVDLFPAREVNVLKGLSIREVQRPVTHSIPENTELGAMLDLVVSSPHSQFFVLNKRNEYKGTISLDELRRLLHERDVLSQVLIARDLLDEDFPVLTPEDDLDLALKLFSHQNIEQIPVVSEEKPRVLMGHVHKSDVLEIYNREIFRRDASGGLAAMLPWAEKARVADLGEGFIMAEVEAPAHFTGKTIREIDIRARYGIQVVLIKKTSSRKGKKTSSLTPQPDYIMETGDVLVILGEKDKVDLFAAGE